MDKLLRNEKIAVAWRQSGANGSLPYSLIVHAYSNLQFDARLHQDSLKPGATATLTASLTEYEVPLASAAMLWADIVGPDQKEFSLKLDDVGPGAYLATFKTLSAGVYSCRVRAEGYSSANKFTREKRLTAIVYHGDYGIIPPDKDDGLCDLLDCLISEKAISEVGIKRLKEMGVDLKAIRECLKARRERTPREHVPGAKMKTTKRTTGKRAAPKVGIRSESPPKPVKAPKPELRPGMSKPMADTPQQWPRIVRMFSREAEEERQRAMQGKAKKRPTKKRPK